jgi:glycosyltransferase involved in cell wall biosynthesis
MARKKSNILFMVFGGSNKFVARRREKNRNLSNIFFKGHLPHHNVQEIMRHMDVLLMPYQAKVSIGVKGHDTAQWMSPMKMFEYMATGLPIISSDLPSLREVLKDKKNALLVSPTDPKQWCEALDCLIVDSELADCIGRQAYQDYKEKYTWGARARKIISLL